MLKLSVVLFVAAATIHLAAGLGLPISLHLRPRPGPAFMSVRSDDIYMKTDVERLLEGGSGPFARLRLVLMDVVAAQLVALGLLEFAVVWFALRSGELWALAALVATAVAVLPFWILVIRIYRSRGAVVTLGEIPLFMWGPPVLMVLGAVIGWFALVV